ncbi:S-adenosyl-L-methionine-dependent methyltransferase [Xylariaceae sp. FL0804]|nr:S-adenosyl-L-methionine-dependent methyltransferase [Xylariaceae sp. FL0804]
MTASDSISELARRLVTAAEKVEAEKNGAASTTNGTAKPSSSSSMKQTLAQRELFDLAMEIQVLARGPVDFLEQYQIYYTTFGAFRWLLHFDIFTHVPLSGPPISYDALAAAASVPPARLRSVARMAMTSALFREPEPDQVAHSPLSAAFARDPLLRAWGAFVTAKGAPTALAMADATARWGDTRSETETAYNVAARTELKFFDHLRSSGQADLFGRYMKSLGMSPGLLPEHLVGAFDWKGRFGENGHIVDVGGSNGWVSLALADALPGFTFTVQDLPEAIASKDTAHDGAAPPAAIASGRIRFQAQNFFEPQAPFDSDPSASSSSSSPRLPDAYFLRKILHDWPDESSHVILGHLGRTLQALRRDHKGKKEGWEPRILINDTVLPPPGSGMPRLHEAMLRVRDLTMGQNFNAGERDLAQWEALLAANEPPLRLLGWNQPPDSVLAVLEVGLAD